MGQQHNIQGLKDRTPRDRRMRQSPVATIAKHEIFIYASRSVMVIMLAVGVRVMTSIRR